MTRELLENKPRANTVESYIVESLHYCCEWYFLQLYKDSELVALRLGVTTNTIRRHRLWIKQGKIIPCCRHQTTV